MIRLGKQRILIFGSGKLIATGFTALNEAKSSVENQFNNDLVKFIKIVNVTGVYKLAKPLNPYKLLNSSLNIEYNPEIYLAMYWRHNKVCIIYYPKGSMVITGGRSIDELREALAKFRKLTENL